VITELGVGEALVSFLDDHGRPTVVERGFVLAAGSRIGPLTAEERRAAIAASPIAGHYEKLVDRESAYENCRARRSRGAAGQARQKSALAARRPGPCGAGAAGAGLLGGLGDASAACCGGACRPARRQTRGRGGGIQHRACDRLVAGREIVRGVLGSIMGGRRR
jgi:hypothetical protein